jgi:hypothetical protein
MVYESMLSGPFAEPVFGGSEKRQDLVIDDQLLVGEVRGVWFVVDVIVHDVASAPGAPPPELCTELHHALGLVVYSS